MHDHPGTAHPDHDGMRFADYRRLLRRHWLLVLTVALAGAMAGALVPQLVLTRFEATSRIVVQPAYPSTTWTEAFDANRLATQLAGSYAELIADRTTAQAVVEQLGLTEDAASLQRRVTVEPVPDTNIITISVVAPTAREAQRVAEAYGVAFQRRIERLQPTAPGTATGPLVSVTVAEPPSLPSAPVAPHPVRGALLGALLGGIVTLGVLVLRDREDDTV